MKAHRQADRPAPNWLVFFLLAGVALASAAVIVWQVIGR